MVYFLDEPGHQKVHDLLVDGPAFLLIEATQPLLHSLGAWPDLQGMLSDFSQNVWHVQGSPRKDVSIGVGKVDERAFLFGGKHGADAHHFALGTAGVYEDLLGALYRLGSGASSTTFPLMAASSLEATIAAMCSQHSTSHS